MRYLSKFVPFLALSISIILCSMATVAGNARAGDEHKTVPVEAFAALPSFNQLKLSPNGEMIGYLIEHEGRKALFIHELSGKQIAFFPAPKDTGDIDTFYWINDDIIIFQISGTIKRHNFLRKSHEVRLHSFNIKTRKVKWLGKPKETQRVSQHENLIDLLPDDPKHILVEMDMELNAMWTVYRINVKTGHRRVVQGEKRGIQNWHTDQNGTVRYGTGYEKTNYRSILKDAKGDWKKLKNVDWKKHFSFAGFTNDANAIYVKGRSEFGTDGIYMLDLETGKRTQTVFTHKEVDIDGMAYDPITGKVNGVYYTTDFQQIHYFDAKMAKIKRSLERVFNADMVVTIENKAANAEKYIAFVENDRDPGTYFIYHRDQKKLEAFAPARKNIDPALMAAVDYQMIPMRDGVDIPAFITMPPKSDGKNLPTIILPHGGPQARDTRHWDYQAQFYANRGYLVLQPNFRGSSGYGDDFYYKGRHQWGGLMQDDVTDATKWLISEGYADPERICIVGSSYGGYAALMGAIKEQNLYKCAISVNGVTDLKRLKKADKRSAIGGRSWTKTMGLKDTDDEAVSPHHRAGDINIPVMIMASVDDARVNYKISKSTHKKLKKLGKDSRYVEIKDGTHHMVTKNARMVLLSETEKFLAKHIGPNSQYASKKEVTSSR